MPPRPRPPSGAPVSSTQGPVGQLAHVSGFSLFAASADEQAEAYTAVLPLIAGGQIAPAHDRSFPLEQAPEALRHLV
jgi:NADPH:quinone reductase-like Zn-dependent oxidoreductase